MVRFFAILLLLSPALAIAQSPIPEGTIIPVELRTTLDSRHAKPGQIVSARVAQDVPLDGNSRIKAGSRVTGEIVASTPRQSTQQATIIMRIDTVEIAGKPVQISTNLRAIASQLEVQAAQSQRSGFEKGAQPPWSQNTIQIGGDAVYREPGLVERRGQRVGESVYAGAWGVLAKVDSDPSTDCRADVAGNDKPQALWVFSHDACGVFGLELVIKDASRKDGEFVLASTKDDVKVHSGSALLLRVNSSSQDQADHR